MRKADNLPPSCAVVMKSGKLNFLEPSGPLQACNGTDLPFRLPVQLCYMNVNTDLLHNAFIFQLSLRHVSAFAVGHGQHVGAIVKN